MVYVKKCQYANHFGNRCGNGEGNTSYIIEKIYNKIDKFEREIRDKLNYNEGRDITHLRMKIETRNLVSSTRKNSQLNGLILPLKKVQMGLINTNCWSTKGFRRARNGS